MISKIVSASEPRGGITTHWNGPGNQWHKQEMMRSLCDRLRAAADPKLVEDLLVVPLDGLRASEELLRDFPVR